MQSTFNFLFFLRKPKNYVNGKITIYMRITVDGRRSELSTARSCEPEQWNASAGRARGNREFVKTLNAFLDNLQNKAYNAQLNLIGSGKQVTADAIRDQILGKTSSSYKLIEIFEEHNLKMEALVGNEYAKGTYGRYKTSLKHTREFLFWKYGVKDIDIEKIDHAFVMNYEFYLKSVRKCANNSTVKYIKNFAKIIRICIANGWLSKDPMLNYKSKLKTVDRVFLTEKELQLIVNKEFSAERLRNVRDIFLFCCFTGLAYVDVKKLKNSDIDFGVDGEPWILTTRQKTNIPSRIPLLPFALSLVERYKAHPYCLNTGSVFPVNSNQKMNAYLKEIVDLCGIKKNITFHIARHTFATTVTLLNGVPIESVSKCWDTPTFEQRNITQKYWI